MEVKEKSRIWPFVFGIVVLLLVIFGIYQCQKRGDQVPPVIPEKIVPAPDPVPAPSSPIAYEEGTLIFNVYTDKGWAPHADLARFTGYHVINPKGDGYDFLLTPGAKGANVGLDKDQTGKRFIYFIMPTSTAYISANFTKWNKVPMINQGNNKWIFYLE